MCVINNKNDIHKKTCTYRQARGDYFLPAHNRSIFVLFIQPCERFRLTDIHVEKRIITPRAMETALFIV